MKSSLLLALSVVFYFILKHYNTVVIQRLQKKKKKKNCCRIFILHYKTRLKSLSYQFLALPTRNKLLDVFDIIFPELYVVNFDQLVGACTQESCFVVFRHFFSFPSFFQCLDEVPNLCKSLKHIFFSK